MKLTLAEMGNIWSASRSVKQESLRNIRKQLWVVHDGTNTTSLAEQARQFRPYKKPKQDDASRDSMAGSSLEISIGKRSGAVGEVRVSHDFEGLCSNEGENMVCTNERHEKVGSLHGEHNVVPVTPAKLGSGKSGFAGKAADFGENHEIIGTEACMGMCNQEKRLYRNNPHKTETEPHLASNKRDHGIARSDRSLRSGTRSVTTQHVVSVSSTEYHTPEQVGRACLCTHACTAWTTSQ